MELTDADVAAFLGLSTEMFAEFGPGDRLVWVNGAVATALGYTEDEVAEMSPARLVHPDDLGAVLEAFGRPGPAAESRGRRSDGTWRWLEWTSCRSADGGSSYGAARDVTDRHLARSAVRSGRARLQAIVDHSTSAIFVKDLDHRYVLVNDAFLVPLGLEPSDVLGKTADEIWPGYVDRGTDAAASLDDRGPADDGPSSADGEPVTGDVVVQLADGPHTMLTVRFPLRDVDGRVVGKAGIATDITDRTKIERRFLGTAKRLLETIVQASPDIVTILDHGGRVREVSQASSRILGYDIDDPVHDELEALVHPDDVPTIYDQYARLLTLACTSLELRFKVRHAQGHWLTLDSRGQSIVGEDGSAVGALVMSRDVTEDLAFEAELLTAVGVAERASLAKSEFLSRMSHELRTPLNAVLGFAQLLEMDDLSDQQGQAVGHILRAGQHLLNLIDEVLDIARIESGHLDLSVEAVLVLDVLGDAVDRARPSAEERAVRLTVDARSCPPDTYALADRQRLLQVLLNLLSNATKDNTGTGGVDIAVSRTDDGRARIAVTDTGDACRPRGSSGRSSSPSTGWAPSTAVSRGRGWA